MLRPVQSLFPPGDYPDLLVGLDSPDDAAVWRLDEARTLVVTTDFFTPVVDDAYDYGAVAAANALSDLYAMGAVPFLALNVAAVPPDLPLDQLREIFRGGAEKVREAGAVVAGGHTLQDREPKYGLVALGMAASTELMTKGGARPGDVLVITKPLGTGVTTTALKEQRASAADVAEAVGWMSRLNAAAARMAVAFGIRGATDVSGFSLLGHALELADASRAGVVIHLPAVPFLRGAAGYARGGFFPTGSADNRAFFGPRVSFEASVDEIEQRLLFDAQTSGGLLLSVPQGALAGFMTAAAEQSLPAWPIGRVTDGEAVSVVDEPFRIAQASPAAKASQAAFLRP